MFNPVRFSFKIKNAGLTVDGSFSSIQSKILVDETNVAKSSFLGIIKANSISTKNKLRDDHLKNKDEFFNVAKYPELEMKSIKVSPSTVAGAYKVEWQLNMKGISKNISSDVYVKKQKGSLFLYTTFKINRRDWKIGSNSLTMNDMVTININSVLTL